MKRLLRFRPSPAMVVACIALSVALGGTSVAAIQALPRNSVGTKQLKNNAVTSPKVKNNSITGADVNEGTFGTVPLATNATTATNATNATSATNASNADKLDNIDSTGFVRPGSAEAWHEIGAPGEPAFQGGWSNEDPTGETTAAFYKDPLDVVHLKGIITGGTSTVFTLPAGYRSSKAGCIVTWRSSAIAYICFFPDGNISQLGGSGTGAMLLDGLTFRVGS